MTRKMVIQEGLFLACGFLLGKGISIPRDEYFGGWGLLFFIFSLMFWMIPRSIDITEIKEIYDYLYHGDMILSGFILAKSLPQVSFIIQFFFGLYISSMIVALGLVFKSEQTPICSAYNLYQQHQVGKVLIYIGLLFYILTIVFLFKKAIEMKKT